MLGDFLGGDFDIDPQCYLASAYDKIDSQDTLKAVIEHPFIFAKSITVSKRN